jgi:3-deoxy-D-manno-octulosonic-acid transferase
VLRKLIRLLPEPVRWAGYILLHRLLHRNTFTITTAIPTQAERYIWIFCSTIGELHACKQLIAHYCKQAKVLLLTDRDIYLASYQQEFPTAAVAVAALDFRHTQSLIKQYPPRLAIVCEIPLLLHDAPCRLSYGVLRLLKKQQVRLCLINGWLYGYQPACKQDSIEKYLFEQDYLNCFDVMSVQTEDIKQRLIAQGARPERLVVSGNMKYDNLDASLTLSEPTQALLNVLRQQPQLFVAGCVTDVWEYELVVRAFANAKQHMSELKLVIAPRHPEKPEQLSALENLLQQHQLVYQYRSQVTAQTLQLNDVLIVDTFGELKAFYAAAYACYVGINHNILEPLSLGKPVAVLGNWEPSYPSYPVFSIARSKQLVTELKTHGDLSDFLQCSSNKQYQPESVISELKKLSGALEKNIQLIDRA